MGNVTWHTFQPHINKTYKELYETKRFTDVTLVSDDHQQFKAHKFILSSSSTMFQSILGDDDAVASCIFLRGVNHLELESILQFIYLGEATFYQIKEIGENKKSEEYIELPSSQESSKAETFEDSTDFDNSVEARTVIAKTRQSEWSCTL